MRPSIVLLGCVSLLAACPPTNLDPIATGDGSSGDPGGGDGDTDGASSVTQGSTPTSEAMVGSSGGTTTSGEAGDEASSETGGTTEVDLLTCAVEGTCNQLDLLLVIDNSGSMGEEQLNLAQQFPLLVERLRTLQDAQGQAVGADVNVMVTTTDLDHPLCTPFYKDDYVPAMGGPINTACVDRLTRFTGYGGSPMMPEACTSVCASAVVPADPFIHFDLEGDNIVGASGLGDPAVEAMACIAPQGVDGCGMESPLEAMKAALDPSAPWNTGDKPFLRPGGVLGVVILTDETDCSTENVDYFDPSYKDDPEFNEYWEPDPAQGGLNQPTSAVCWNASMTCDDDDDDGVYESCVAEDREALFPMARYTDLLADSFEAAGKPVFMLLLGGVPQVTAHADEPPHGPSAGGILELVYRQWVPADILPGDPKPAEQKEYEFGIGPGCSNAAAGQAVPPGRLQNVCESLDQPGELRCCIESICDDDFSGAVECLADMLAQRLTAD